MAKLWGFGRGLQEIGRQWYGVGVMGGRWLWWPQRLHIKCVCVGEDKGCKHDYGLRELER